MFPQEGPNKASVKDFWRMVWQENCGIIVMLTNVSEGGKRKCEKYWPDDHLKYGHLKVDCTSSVVYTSYTISTFSLSQVDDVDQKIKTVTHYHFTAWPDMKVPEFAGPFSTSCTWSETNKRNGSPRVLSWSTAGKYKAL
ncbi:putative receptor-type tyrosine-protein phosphatase F isoform X1 [Apostichopus japonicus]|uniref:Putative receptor-type tyrosine-protein phosphatase F isoform X1 n=1 Tax=Stichopus japonicus TaxID=307972 RepID=A0A2G8JYI0_STIJA|nr:putative receptor-type tyrosine-protein phosphatase F isoform X1 [Apostichopus japonicus]